MSCYIYVSNPTVSFRCSISIHVLCIWPLPRPMQYACTHNWQHHSLSIRNALETSLGKQVLNKDKLGLFSIPHDDVLTWKLFLHSQPSVRGIHSPVDSPPQGPVRPAKFCFIISVSLKKLLKKIIKLPTIWDTTMLMRYHCDKLGPCKFYPVRGWIRYIVFLQLGWAIV